jgi:hypothetical protein
LERIGSRFLVGFFSTFPYRVCFALFNTTPLGGFKPFGNPYNDLERFLYSLKEVFPKRIQSPEGFYFGLPIDCVG